MLILYARQSVERENSISIETQIEYCKACLRPEDKNEKIKIYTDEGKSGGNTNREGFQKMMRDIKTGHITKVVTYKLDRISRSLNDFVNILHDFKEYNVEFVSASEAFDSSTPYGDLILKILMVFAEFERTSIINRVKDAYAKRTDIGLYMGGRRQYGFLLQEFILHGIKTKIYIPIHEEIEHINYIFELYSKPNITLRMVLSSLVENGVKPLSGKDWTTAKLSSLIKNPIYVKTDSEIYDYFSRNNVRIVNEIKEFNGLHAAMLYGKTTHDNNLVDWSDMKLVLTQHEGVIASDIWLLCQNKIEKNKQLGNSLSNRTSWLAGKIICAKCGHTMTTIKSLKKDGSYRRYFNCTGKSHKKTCTGVKTTVYADDMENLVENSIYERLKSIQDIKKTMKNTSYTKVNTLKLQIIEIENQEKAIWDKLMDDNFNIYMVQIMNEKAGNLSKNKQELLKKISDCKVEDTDIDCTLNLSRKWKTANFQEKKAVIGVIINSIILYEDGNAEIVWNF